MTGERERANTYISTYTYRKQEKEGLRGNILGDKAKRLETGEGKKMKKVIELTAAVLTAACLISRRTE
jgi:hypothetical protein